jgi:hypothetical protein
MTNLFNIEPAFVGNIISVNRNITLNDVDIVPFSSIKDDATNSAYCGVAITLKPNVITALQEALDIKISPKGSYVIHKDQLNGVTHGWDAKTPFTHRAIISKEISYRGLRTQESQTERYNKTLENVTTEFESDKTEFINKKLMKIDEIIKTHLNNRKQQITDRLKNIVIKLNIKNIDSFLKDDDVKKVAKLEEKASKIERQIDELKSKRNAIKQDIYTTKRCAVTLTAEKELGEQGNAILNSIKNEDTNISTSDMFENFG